MLDRSKYCSKLNEKVTNYYELNSTFYYRVIPGDNTGRVIKDHEIDTDEESKKEEVKMSVA